MKTHVQMYIQNCRSHLKKLIRIKTQHPMIFTDTSGATFDKISMDIMEPSPLRYIR